MSTKSPSGRSRGGARSRTNHPTPPAATGRRREQARDLDLPASPSQPSASGGLV